jgi:hypothetical protein
MTSIDTAILQALPDLTLVVRSDGVIVGNVGGRNLGIADEPGELIGTSLREVWTADIAAHLNLLVRRTLRTRAPVERQYEYNDRSYSVRVQPQGVDRVLMVLRDVTQNSADCGAGEIVEESTWTPPEGRAVFEERLASALQTCKLRETPMTLAAIHLGGLRKRHRTHRPSAESGAICSSCCSSACRIAK